jgi:hypothetical protein
MRLVFFVVYSIVGIPEIVGRGIAVAYFLIWSLEYCLVVVGKSIITNLGYFSSGRFLIGKGLNVYCFYN